MNDIEFEILAYADEVLAEIERKGRDISYGVLSYYDDHLDELDVYIACSLDIAYDTGEPADQITVELRQQDGTGTELGCVLCFDFERFALADAIWRIYRFADGE